MKRGLFVCYDPHALMQFLQFYCMGDFPAEWDVLCLPVENGEEYMHTYCEKTEIFKNIFTGNVEYMNLPLLKKIGLFLYMFFFAIIGLRKTCCKNILNKYVNDIDQYDILCSNIDTGFISGMLANFGKEKDVIYFEDGAGDYTIKRSKWKNSIFPILSFINIQCVFMAWFGYCAKGCMYFKLTKFCYKYVTNKYALTYKNYKDIREFKFNELSHLKFKNIIEALYPELNELSFQNNAVILFTEPMSDYLDDYEKFNMDLINYISNKYKYVYLKKHPRDYYNYEFPSFVKVNVLNSKIPGEILFPFFKNNICIFYEFSSVIIGMNLYNLKVLLLHFKEFENKLLKCKYTNLNEKKKYMDIFIKNNYEIVEI